MEMQYIHLEYVREAIVFRIILIIVGVYAFSVNTTSYIYEKYLNLNILKTNILYRKVLLRAMWYIFAACLECFESQKFLFYIKAYSYKIM